MTSNVQTIPLELIDFDPKNARGHNGRNIGMIESSLQENGAGRSVLLVPKPDGRYKCIAGEGTITAARQAGFTHMQIVHGDPKVLTGVVRDDLDERQQIRMALFDNRSGEMSHWDAFQFFSIQNDFDGIGDGIFDEHGMADLLRIAANTLDTEGPGAQASEIDVDSVSTMSLNEAAHETEPTMESASSRARYPLAIILDHQAKRRWDAWKQTQQVKSDTLAFLALLDEALDHSEK